MAKTKHKAQRREEEGEEEKEKQQPRLWVYLARNFQKVQLPIIITISSCTNTTSILKLVQTAYKKTTKQNMSSFSKASFQDAGFCTWWWTAAFSGKKGEQTATKRWWWFTAVAVAASLVDFWFALILYKWALKCVPDSSSKSSGLLAKEKEGEKNDKKGKIFRDDSRRGCW